MSEKLTWKEKYEKAVHFCRCAQINMETLAKHNPALRKHPIFNLMKQQVDWALEDSCDERKGDE